jgi:hypothetical protein
MKFTGEINFSPEITFGKVSLLAGLSLQRIRKLSQESGDKKLMASQMSLGQL